MTPNLRGDRITRLRKERGITQYDLADMLDISQNQVSRYERSAMNPGIDTLVRIANCFDTTTDYLLGLSDIPHPGAEPDANADLTPDEIELLTIYRERSAANRKRLLDILAIMGDMQDDD